MNVHVTGASGFLGCHVVPMLIARGYDVSALVRSRVAADKAKNLGAEPIVGDLDDAQALDRAFASAGAHTLVNLASLGFGHAPAIVAAAEEAGVKRAVFVSTTAVTTTLAADSRTVRLAAEQTIQDSALEWTIVRPTMIYGTLGDRNMARLLRFLRKSPVMPLPNGGRGLQQPVHVEDVAVAVVAAVEAREAVGRVYDVAGPEPLTFRQIVEQAGGAVGRRPRLVAVPLAPTLGAVRIYERIASRPLLKAEQLQRLVEDKVFDISPARNDLGYAPRSFREGIEQEALLLR